MKYNSDLDVEGCVVQREHGITHSDTSQSVVLALSVDLLASCIVHSAAHFTLPSDFISLYWGTCSGKCLSDSPNRAGDFRGCDAFHKVFYG
jgi:hypothetical protein